MAGQEEGEFPEVTRVAGGADPLGMAIVLFRRASTVCAVVLGLPAPLTPATELRSPPVVTLHRRLGGCL